MTPERKKKLRLLLRKKAAEELKRQQEAKANERRRVISERTGAKENLDSLSSEEELRRICRKYHERMSSLESRKWDLEQAVGKKELEVHNLSSQVSDQRGKFVKPPLKRVPKYEQKIERMLLNARKEIGFTVTLKSVKRDQYRVDEPKDSKDEAPEWSWKKSSGGAAGPAGASGQPEEGAHES